MKDILMAPGPMPDWASYSAIGTFRACPQRWHYAYLRRLERAPDIDDAKVELNFGIWWHAYRAAVSIEEGRELGSMILTPKTIGTPAGDLSTGTSSLRMNVLAMARDWYKNLPEEHKATWEDKLGEGTPDRLLALDRRWRHQWEADNRNEIPLGVEVKWVRELPDGTELLGYIDQVYQDRRRGIVVIRDYKTSKGLATQTAVDDMMDSQLHLYAWGVSPVLAVHGLRASALSYDRCNSVKATTPRLNQSGTLSKTVTNFDILSYRDWVAEGQEYPGRAKDGSQAGVYQLDEAMVEHLTSPVWVSRWFQRTLVPVNRNLVKSHLLAAADSLADMRATAERTRASGEAPRNLGPACRWCDFAALCRAQMQGGPDGEYDPGDFGLVTRD